MAIHYPLGTLVYREIDFGTRDEALTGISQALLDAGWTLTSEEQGYMEITWGRNGGNSTGNSWIRIDTITYWYRDTPTESTPYEVQTAADFNQAAVNFCNAINASGGGYSSATTPHPTCEAEVRTAGIVRVKWKVPGISSTGHDCDADWYAYVSFDSSVFRFGGGKFDSVPTEGAGFQARLYVFDENSGQGITIVPMTVDEEYGGADGAMLLPQADRKLMVRAHGHGIWTWINASYFGDDKAQMQFEVPWVPDMHLPPDATAATLIEQAFWLRASIMRTGGGSTASSFRVAMFPGGYGSLALLNQYLVVQSYNGLCSGMKVVDLQRYPTWDRFWDLVEARIGWRVTTTSGQFFQIGELWGAFIVNRPADGDITKAGFDGHDWISYLHNDSVGSLWLSTT